MKTFSLLTLTSAIAAGSAFAAELPVGAPVRPTLAALKCPAGKKAFNDGEGLFCIGTAPAAERLHGPAIGLHKNGVKSFEGTYVDGKREGQFVYFDEQGNKVREIEFRADSYDGKYVEYVSGRKVKEETYVLGLRQGAQLAYDSQGVASITEYRNDRPVAR